MSAKPPSIVFIVLHYVALEETQTAVDSILTSYADYPITVVIVDNASPNGSGKQLEEAYADEARVVTLLLDANLGFANGNNYGYQYAKEQLNPEFIVFLNNDIVINQPTFIDKARELFAETSCAVLGPDVFVPSLSLHQNPKRLTPYGVEEAQCALKSNRFYLAHKKLLRLRLLVKRLPHLRESVLRHRRDTELAAMGEQQSNVVLHGSCVLVSRSFIDARSCAFNPDTFMYYEMEILDLECRKAGLMSLYSPELAVEHHHAMSTQQSMPDAFKREVFMREASVDSLEVFIRVAEAGA